MMRKNTIFSPKRKTSRCLLRRGKPFPGLWKRSLGVLRHTMRSSFFRRLRFTERINSTLPSVITPIRPMNISIMSIILLPKVADERMPHVSPAVARADDASKMILRKSVSDGSKRAMRYMPKKSMNV